MYVMMEEGDGPAPTADDTVEVHYVGTFLDGKEFDSSVKRGQPATFPLRGVIKGWTEGVALMKVGGKCKLICPPDLAYGEGDRPGIPPSSTLVFDIELLSIKDR
ncbi:MAG: FKBP-type peptidyl-prolyl cis-trans isomerase [Phycisphaerae bacterium]|nr:FKBP-type peptidyl-prolyl cis-trans isomerase [Phycisphaerae bacterium]